MQTLGSAAVASALPQTIMGQQRQRVAVFSEPGFPSLQTNVTPETVRQSLGDFSVTFLAEPDLIARLRAGDFDLFINPYGSAFPKRAWDVLLKYLRGGGNWLNCGGVPLSRPVVRVASGWRWIGHPGV